MVHKKSATQALVVDLPGPVCRQAGGRQGNCFAPVPLHFLDTICASSVHCECWFLCRCSSVGRATVS